MRIHWIVWALVAAACGDGAGGDDLDAAAQVDAGGGPSFAEPPALVRVAERSDNMGGAWSTSATATLQRATTTPYTETSAAGSCRLLAGDGGFCAQPCDGWCRGDGTCVPFPTQYSAGAITISGLTQPVTLTPAGGAYAAWGDNGHFVQPGVAVGAAAPGGDFGGFSLSVAPPAPLVVPDLAGLAIDPARDLTIEWTPGGDPAARVHLWLHTDRGHAAIHPVVIECDAPDTGSLTVPQAMIAAYADPAAWSCGDCIPSWIERVTRARATVDGTELELRVSSQVELYLLPW